MPGVIQTGCAAEFAHAVVIAASSAPGARLPDAEITFQLDPPALAVPVTRINAAAHKHCFIENISSNIYLLSPLYKMSNSWNRRR
jgi:hypothetical protein